MSLMIFKTRTLAHTYNTHSHSHSDMIEGREGRKREGIKEEGRFKMIDLRKAGRGGGGEGRRVMGKEKN